jgi:hypothetical protein
VTPGSTRHYFGRFGGGGVGVYGGLGTGIVFAGGGRLIVGFGAPGMLSGILTGVFPAMVCVTSSS